MTACLSSRRFGDNPVERFADDGLDRRKGVEVLADLLSRDDLDTPLSLGIYGSWGSGKTSVMRMLKDKLTGEKSVCVWLDAWRYAGDGPALWRALFLALIEKLREHPAVSQRKDNAKFEAELDKVVTALYRSAEYVDKTDFKVNWKAMIPLMAKSVLWPLADVLDKTVVDEMKKAYGGGKDFELMGSLLQKAEEKSYREHISSLEQFPVEFKRLVDAYVTNEGRRLFVFIDDLDRCLPEAAVGALEAIKQFLDLGNCVFVLGMDRTVVEEGIKVRYAGQPGVAAVQYLDKIIQIPFNLPPLRNEAMVQFVEGWCEVNGCPDLKPCAKTIATGTDPNPRTVKRTLNVLRLTRELGKAAGFGDDKYLLPLARLVVIQMSYPEFYKKVVAFPPMLPRLELKQEQIAEGEIVALQRLQAMLWEPDGQIGKLPDSALLVENLIHLTQMTGPGRDSDHIE